MEIYRTIAVILSFLVHFFLILGTNRISGYGAGVPKAALAALLGTAYTALALLPDFRFLSSLPWRIVVLCMMSMIAFGWNVSACRRTVIFLLLTMAMSGLATGIEKGGFLTAFLAALMVSLLCRIGFGGRPGQKQYIPVTITHNGKTIHLTALVDTGNTLRDPLSGRPALVVDATVARQLLDLTDDQLLHPIETLTKLTVPGLRLIPYYTVGQSNGMLLGLRVQQLVVNGKREDMIVAFAPQKIGQGRAYQALAGGLV